MFEEPQTATPNTKLRERRNAKHWTQTDLAGALGVTESTIKGWEGGYVIPSPLYVKKLCDFFQATPEELGILSTEGNHKDILFAEEQYAAPSRRSSRQYELEHSGIPVVKSIRLRLIVLLSICSVLVLSGILVVLLIPHLGGSTQHAPLTSSPTNSELYHADWSSGFDHWATTPGWQWTDAEGGMITTPPTIANTLLAAPYHPTATDYSIEAQIKRMNYSGKGGQAYGLVVHLANGGGYICGVGIHYTPEHFFAGLIEAPTPAAPYYQITDYAHTTALLDNTWHTYRIAIKDKKMTCQVDGTQVVSTAITTNPPAGNVGIYVDNASIFVRRFIVQQ